MLTCDDCGVALNEDVARISEIKIRRRVCRSCRVAVTNPCVEMVTQPVGVHPTPQPYFRRRFTIPELEAKIEKAKNVPVMVTVLQAALDWPSDEVEAMAEHLFEIATATTVPEVGRGLVGNLSVTDYVNLMHSIGLSVVSTKSAAVITDVL